MHVQYKFYVIDYYMLFLPTAIEILKNSSISISVVRFAFDDEKK